MLISRGGRGCQKVITMCNLSLAGAHDWNTSTYWLTNFQSFVGSLNGRWWAHAGAALSQIHLAMTSNFRTTHKSPRLDDLFQGHKCVWAVSGCLVSRDRCCQWQLYQLWWNRKGPNPRSTFYLAPSSRSAQAALATAAAHPEWRLTHIFVLLLWPTVGQISHVYEFQAAFWVRHTKY